MLENAMPQFISITQNTGKQKLEMHFISYRSSMTVIPFKEDQIVDPLFKVHYADSCLVQYTEMLEHKIVTSIFPGESR